MKQRQQAAPVVDPQRALLLAFIQATGAETWQRSVKSSLLTVSLFVFTLLLVPFLHAYPGLFLFFIVVLIGLLHRLKGRRTIPREWLGEIPPAWLVQGTVVRDALPELPKSLLPEILQLAEAVEALPLLPEGRSQKRGQHFRRANRMISEVQEALFMALVRLLPRLVPDELAKLTLENRAFLCRAIKRSADASFLAAILLTLASLGDSTLLATAQEYVNHHPSERVREAAREYLLALETNS